MRTKMRTILISIAAGVLIFCISCSKDENSPEIKVLADFSADTTLIVVDNEVNFIDQSTGEPDTWLWTFEGGEPSTSTGQNPSVIYSSAGEYKVTLKVSNDQSEDTRTIDNYITVTEIPVPDEFDIIGTWERVESNAPALDGMILTVNDEETEGAITYTPSSYYNVDDIKWKSIVKISEYEYTFEDMSSTGSYTENKSIFIIANGNELIIGNFYESNGGSFQRWARTNLQYPEGDDYNLIGTWERTKSNSTALDSMKVFINDGQTQGIITYSPDTVNFPVGELKWKNIT